ITRRRHALALWAPTLIQRSNGNGNWLVDKLTFASGFENTSAITFKFCLGRLQRRDSSFQPRELFFDLRHDLLLLVERRKQEFAFECLPNDDEWLRRAAALPEVFVIDAVPKKFSIDQIFIWPNDVCIRDCRPLP